MKQLYQGDVALISIQEVPNIELKSLPKNGVVVAEGEVTGHNHIIVKEREDVEIEWGQDINGFYFKIAGGNAVITHPEHKQITLNPGVWFVANQFEYDELKDIKVKD